MSQVVVLPNNSYKPITCIRRRRIWSNSLDIPQLREDVIKPVRCYHLVAYFPISLISYHSCSYNYINTLFMNAFFQQHLIFTVTLVFVFPCYIYIYNQLFLQSSQKKTALQNQKDGKIDKRKDMSLSPLSLPSVLNFTSRLKYPTLIVVHETLMKWMNDYRNK